ncbi:MAG: ATP-dependent DNA helicase RecQ, partial [Glaciecola sp.]
GSAKLLKYAELFLSIIVDFCVQHGLQEVSNMQTASAQVKKEMPKSTSVGSKTKEVVEQFENGRSVADLSRLLKIKDNTIYNHLYKYAQLGNKLTKPERLIDEAQLTAEQVQAGIVAFEAHGSERLKPVYEALGEDIKYEQLHLLRAFYLH